MVGKFNQLIALVSASIILIQGGCSGNGSSNGKLLPSHGGDVELIAIDAIHKGFCLKPDLFEFQEALQSAFGENQVCLINHIVTPNWMPDCGKSGIASIVDTTNCGWGLCDLDEFYKISIELLDSLCSLRELRDSLYNLELDHSIFSENALVEKNANAKSIDKIEERIEFVKNSLIADLNAKYEEEFEKQLAQVNPPIYGCGSGVGTLQRRFKTLFCNNGESICTCVSRQRTLTDRYLQDYFAVHRSWNGSIHLSSSKEVVAKTGITGANYVRKQCDCRIDSTITKSKVLFEGGDMLVSDKFILMGKDIVWKYFDNDQLGKCGLSELGLPDTLKMNSGNSEKLRSQIEYELTNDLQKVIFVGTRDTMFKETAHWKSGKRGNGQSFQPAYHLDVFLALIGSMENCKDTFKYLVATPFLKHYNVAGIDTISMIKEVQEGVDSLIVNLTAQLACYSKVVLPIKVPMLATIRSFSGSLMFDQHYSFVNGISMERNDHSVFVYPDHGEFYPPYSFNYSHPFNYSLAKAEFDSILRKHRIHPVPVKFEYGPGAGLHCRSKVLRRSY